MRNLAPSRIAVRRARCGIKAIVPALRRPARSRLPASWLNTMGHFSSHLANAQTLSDSTPNAKRYSRYLPVSGTVTRQRLHGVRGGIYSAFTSGHDAGTGIAPASVRSSGDVAYDDSGSDSSSGPCRSGPQGQGAGSVICSLDLWHL